MIRNFLFVLITLSMLAIAGPISAEQSVTVGGYTIHYNAFPSESLTAEVARNYGIKRSKTRALLNVSVLAGTSEPADQPVLAAKPVEAKVTASASNLTGQFREIAMRKISESGAIYYIGEVSVSNEETLKFTVQVQADGMDEPATLNFDQQFFTR